MNTKKLLVTFAAMAGGGIVSNVVHYLNAPNRAYSQCKEEYLGRHIPDQVFDRCRPKKMEFDSECLGLAALLMTSAREYARRCEKNYNYDNYESDPHSILIGMGVGLVLTLAPYLIPNTIEEQKNVDTATSEMKESKYSVEASDMMQNTKRFY